MCPECGSDDIRLVHMNYFRDPDTGYTDQVVEFTCFGCGALLDDSEVIKPATQQEPK